ncbi:hypothetical protein WJX73_002571 [Symbiochloris irregularis]|uniref:N-acetyltransferase domain-containing protein n=1 Tax=Symbiochloris irregularis TaxID=706552 RepID=A0AAW1NSN3_9CHLO
MASTVQCLNTYYEDRADSRFVQHSRTKFAKQEARALTQRETATCLVVRSVETNAVLATLDIHAPETVSGKPTTGVPEGIDTAAYIMNVTVDEDARGQGIAKLLIDAAAGFAKETWTATCVYVQVAWNLYCTCGFQEASEKDLAATDTENKLLRLDLASFSSSISVI